MSKVIENQESPAEATDAQGVVHDVRFKLYGFFCFDFRRKMFENDGFNLFLARLNAFELDLFQCTNFEKKSKNRIEFGAEDEPQKFQLTATGQGPSESHFTIGVQKLFSHL